MEIKCSECQETKDSEEFYNNRSKANGKDPLCKLCRKERNRAFSARRPDYHKHYYRRVQKPLDEAYGGRQAALAARRKARVAQDTPDI